MNYLVLLVATVASVIHAAPTDFNINHALPAGNVKDLWFVSRIILPYGPDIYSDNEPQSSEDRPFRGYGFGMVCVTIVATFAFFF
jgi:hypothetical protein